MDKKSRSLVCLGVAFFSMPILFFFVGCSSQTLQYPEDHARFKKIVHAVEEMRSAYEGKDLVALADGMLSAEGLQQLQAEIQKDFLTYSTIRLAMIIERIMINGEKVTVNVRWEGDWLKNSQEPETTTSGHGILVWSGTETIVLVDVSGDLPFGMATREAML